MARYEVFIPHAASAMPDMTLHISADNWLLALQAGRKKLGEQGELGSNIVCDFADDGSVHVTDPATGRVFRIMEMPEVAETEPAPAPVAPAPVPAAAPAPVPAPVAPAPAPVAAPAPAPAPVAPAPVPAAAPAPQPQAAPPPKAEAKPAPVPAPAAPKAPPAPPPREEKAAPAAPKQAEKVAPVQEKKAPKVAPQPVEAKAAEIKAKVEVAAAPAAAPKGPIGRKQEKGGNIEDALANIFQASMDLWSTCKTKQDVANFYIDLALKEIKAESAGFLFCDIGCPELVFLAARGPKGNEVLKHKVPLGAGIVGFCVQSGVSLSISDVNKDPRWYDRIGKSVGYATKSLMCSVIQYDGQSLGAIELINKAGSSAFTIDEMNILNYVAHEAGDALSRIMDQEFAAKSKGSK